MCVNDDVRRLKSVQLINDRCLELQKKSGKLVCPLKRISSSYYLGGVRFLPCSKNQKKYSNIVYITCSICLLGFRSHLKF